MDREYVSYIQNGVLATRKNEICHLQKNARNSAVKWNKAESEKQILHAFSYIKKIEF
jgi:hypothetical protein